MAVAKRAGWIFLALLFLFTSIGYSIFVIFQIHSENKQADKTAAVQKVLASQQTKSKASNTTQTQEGKLKGTKLANFTPLDQVAELQKIDTKEGTGEEVKPGDTVTVNYTGATVKDGVIFESSLDSGQTATFGLNQVIKGWTDGLPGMKVGGTRRLLIPYVQAYGEQGSGTIPAKADLVFDIDLIKIGQ